MSSQEIILKILRQIGENPNRQGLIDTPNRVAKMWQEVFKGYDKSQKPEVTVFSNKEDGIDYNQMIIDKGYFFSHCEHHIIPFFGQYYFGYIPNKKIIGLSKISRIVDWYSSKLQVQERLTTEIVNELQKLLKPQGLILIIEARHLCKEMRGVKKINSMMTTSAVKGLFLKDNGARSEFLQLIKLKS